MPLSARSKKAHYGIAIGIAIIFAAVSPASAIKDNSSESNSVNYQDLIRSVKWILVTVENLDPETEKPHKLIEQIRNDAQLKLSQYSIQARMTEKADQIPAKSYLWVRVRKIHLERTVYLNSLELVVKGDESKTETPPKYTRVSNQLYTVRQKIGYLLNDLIRDYLR